MCPIEANEPIDCDIEIGTVKKCLSNEKGKKVKRDLKGFDSRDKRKLTFSFRKFVSAGSLVGLCLTLGLAACGGGGNGGDDKGSTGQLRGDCSVKIFGGEQCPSAVGPVVALESTNRQGEPVYLCSGVFLTAQHILTAGHCADDPNLSLSALLKDAKVRASNSVVHPKYRHDLEDDATRGYDVAVIVLEKPVLTSTLPLLESEATVRGQKATIFGFGENQDGDAPVETGGSPLTPKAAQVTVGGIVDGDILFGSNKDGACPGDSGGPAVRTSAQGALGVVGIASAAPKVCGPASLKISDLETNLGRPLTSEERAEINQVIVDGEVPLNLYVDIQRKEITDFIIQNVPGVELR